MTGRLHHSPSVFCLVAAATAFAGCLGGGSWLGPLIGVLAGLATMAGCSNRKDPGRSIDCCVNGRVTVCACSPQSACNYSPFLNNGDGTCSTKVFGEPQDAATDASSEATDTGPLQADAPVDGIADTTLDTASEPRHAGFSYDCCFGGRIETCYCSPSEACNYAPYQRCGDGTCYSPPPGVDADNMCPRDAGPH
jgi:hypothetical protein